MASNHDYPKKTLEAWSRTIGFPVNTLEAILNKHGEELVSTQNGGPTLDEHRLVELFEDQYLVAPVHLFAYERRRLVRNASRNFGGNTLQALYEALDHAEEKLHALDGAQDPFYAWNLTPFQVARSLAFLAKTNKWKTRDEHAKRLLLQKLAFKEWSYWSRREKVLEDQVTNLFRSDPWTPSPGVVFPIVPLRPYVKSRNASWQKWYRWCVRREIPHYRFSITTASKRCYIHYFVNPVKLEEYLQDPESTDAPSQGEKAVEPTTKDSEGSTPDAGASENAPELHNGRAHRELIRPLRLVRPLASESR